jgi:hypothetical protein
MQWSAPDPREAADHFSLCFALGAGGFLGGRADCAASTIVPRTSAGVRTVVGRVKMVVDNFGVSTS